MRIRIAIEIDVPDDTDAEDFIEEMQERLTPILMDYGHGQAAIYAMSGTEAADGR